MLIDKGYYDYDYQEPKAKVQDVAPKNADETKKMLARFGVGVARKAVAESAEELQRLGMESVSESGK